MGEMGERERLEQEHADIMRLKNRDESAVKVQFQIDAYKRVFAEQRLAASRAAERVRQAKLREAQAQKVVDDARKQELRQIVSKQLEAVKLKRSTRACCFRAIASSLISSAADAVGGERDAG